MKECEGDGSRRKSEAVEKECRTSGGQTDMTDECVRTGATQADGCMMMSCMEYQSESYLHQCSMHTFAGTVCANLSCHNS